MISKSILECDSRSARKTSRSFPAASDLRIHFLGDAATERSSPAIPRELSDLGYVSAPRSSSEASSRKKSRDGGPEVAPVIVILLVPNEVHDTVEMPKAKNVSGRDISRMSPIDVSTLRDQISDCLATAFRHSAARGQASRGRDAPSARMPGLTAREREVMQLILEGFPNKNIAADLGISMRTVEHHRAAIMKKSGCRSLPALVRMALAAEEIPAAPVARAARG